MNVYRVLGQFTKEELILSLFEPHTETKLNSMIKQIKELRRLNEKIYRLETDILAITVRSPDEK